MHLFNEIHLLMLFVTHILAGGYFHTKNEMLAVNIVEGIKRIRIRRTTDGRTERQTERQTDGQTEERRTDRRQDNVNHSIPQNTSINSAYMYLNVSAGYTHMCLNTIYILSHVQHMLQTLRPVDLIWVWGVDCTEDNFCLYTTKYEQHSNIKLPSELGTFGWIKTPVAEKGTLGKTGCFTVEKTHVI